MNMMERMKRARTMLLFKQPFFGRLAAHLKFTESVAYDTMATEGRHLFFNASFVEKLSVNQTLTGVCHEVLHCVSGHFKRQGTRDSNRWQKASDYAINDLLVRNGFEAIDIPGVFKWLYDPQYTGMTAEEIYEKLPPDPPPGKGNPPQEKSCAFAPPPPEAEDHFDPNVDPNAPPPPPPPPPVNWKQAAAEAREYAKARGSMPTGVEEMVDEILYPPVDWERYVKNAMTVACRTGYSYSRPNKRYAHLGMAMPVHYGYRSDAEVWGDSSGSMSNDDFQIFLGGAVTIARQLKCRLNAGVCDAKVQAFYPNLKDESAIRKIKFLGRGGTDFRPIFDHIREGKRKPALVVIFTDLCGTYPEKRPSYNVLWVCRNEVEGWKPPFGRTLVLPEKLERKKYSVAK